MLVEYDPRDYVWKVETYTCPFHKENPQFGYAGCTCTTNYTMRRKSEEEKEEDRKVRD
jgi:hypothetical protein